MRLSELLMMVRPEDKSEDIIIKMLKSAFNRIDILEERIRGYQEMMNEYDAVLNTLRRCARTRYSDVYHGDALDFDSVYPGDDGYEMVKKYLLGDEDVSDGQAGE